MTNRLDYMTIKDEKVGERLSRFLGKVSSYSGFKGDQKILVLLDHEDDFILFEGVEYRLGFSNNAHSLLDYINDPDPNMFYCSFRDLKEAVERILWGYERRSFYERNGDTQYERVTN